MFAKTKTKKMARANKAEYVNSVAVATVRKIAKFNFKQLYVETVINDKEKTAKIILYQPEPESIDEKILEDFMLEFKKAWGENHYSYEYIPFGSPDNPIKAVEKEEENEQ